MIEEGLKVWGTVSLTPNFMDFVSMCMIHIVWWTTSSSITTESIKTMLGNLGSQQYGTKSMRQEASRSWFYVIFECITKDCSKNKGLLTRTLFYVQPFQQTVLALLSLPFPHLFSDGLDFNFVSNWLFIICSRVRFFWLFDQHVCCDGWTVACQNQFSLWIY